MEYRLEPLAVLIVENFLPKLFCLPRPGDDKVGDKGELGLSVGSPNESYTSEKKAPITSLD